MYGLAVKVMPGELWTGKVLCGRARYGLVRSGMAVKAGNGYAMSVGVS